MNEGKMSRKRAAETYQPDDGFVEDAPSSKKSRNTDGSANQKSKRDKEHADLAVHINDQGDSYWEVSGGFPARLGKINRIRCCRAYQKQSLPLANPWCRGLTSLSPADEESPPHGGQIPRTRQCRHPRVLRKGWQATSRKEGIQI